MPLYVKFFVSLVLSVSWVVFSVVLSIPWLLELSYVVGFPFALFVISFIAYVPGFTNFFVVTSLMIDKRYIKPELDEYPPITILIAAYNEEPYIASTLQSIIDQGYKGNYHVIVANDGSSDKTAEIVNGFAAQYPQIFLLDLEENVGKAGALNRGFENVETELFVTIDGDTEFYNNALNRIVEYYEYDSDNVGAIAGAIIMKNIESSFITRLQAWDYFIGISAIKRVQSLYQGTLVAQGAFSLYRRDVVEEVGGWSETVGEDIVLSWGILEKKYRILHAESALCYTNAPESVSQFWKQRARWSRGLVEAFYQHWRLLFVPRYSMFFIWWNLFFPILDLVYTFIFIPGIFIAIFFSIFWIAGPYTLFVLPLALLLNTVILLIQIQMYKRQDVKLKGNVFGFIMYILFYGIIMIPACVYGYVSELIGRRKQWGTK